MATSIIAMFKPPNRPKADAIISAVKANPALAKEVDAASGNTPLHFACCNCAPDEVVHALLAAYPKAAKAADGAGNLPIVGAVASGCGIAAVQALLKAHPEGIRARQGPHTLLHTAACNGQTVDVIDLLIATWPEAAAEQDSSILQSNPLLDPTRLGASGGAAGGFAVKRRWDDDVVFKNQSREPKKEARRFINDTVRNDFHKRFLNKYVK